MVDVYPVPDGTHSIVYSGYSTSTADCATPKSYSNTPFTDIDVTHKTLEHVNNVWQCSGCKDKFELTVSITSENETEWNYGIEPTNPAKFTVTETHTFDIPSGVAEYQWYRDGQKIDNAKSPTYTVVPANIPTAKTYAYTCEVSYGGCKVTSDPQTVTVKKPEAEIKPVYPTENPDPDTTDPEVPAVKEDGAIKPPSSDFEEDLSIVADYSCSYGEDAKITVQVVPVATTQKARARALNPKPYGDNQVAVFYKGEQISEPGTVKDNQADLIIKTLEAGLKPNEYNKAYPLTVRYYGSAGLGAVAANITLTVRYFDTAVEAEIIGTPSESGWYTSAVDLKAPSTWKIADSPDGWSSDWANNDEDKSLTISEEGDKEHTYYIRNVYNGRIAKKTVRLKIDSDELALYERSVPSVDSATVTLSSNKEDVTYTLTKADGSTTGIEDKDNGVFEITGLTPLTEYTYKATCKDTTGHTATTDVKFRTLGKTLASANVTVDDEGLVYDGTAKTPEVTVKIGENALDEGAEYELEYSNNTDAGTATVTIIGKGEYENTRTSETFKIAQKDVTVAVTIKEKTYDGKTTAEIKEVTVPDTVSGETLTYKTGLTAAFEDANAGTDKAVTLSGTPTFEGSVARNYNITLPNGVKGTITPLRLTSFTMDKTFTKKYDGTPFDPNGRATVETGSESAAKLAVIEYTWKNADGEAITSPVVNAGTYKLIASLKGSGSNFEIAGNVATSLEATVTIEKGTLEASNSSITIQNNRDFDYPCDLTKLFSNPSSSGSHGGAVEYKAAIKLNSKYADSDYKNKLSMTGSGADWKLHVEQTEEHAEEKIGVVEVTLNSPNYTAEPAIIDIIATSKTVVEISGVSIASKTYDGKPVEPAGKPVVKSTIEGGLGVEIDDNGFLYTYTDKDGQNATKTAPKNAGSYILTVSIKDGMDVAGSRSFPFEIAKRQVEWDTSGLTAVKKYDGTMAPPAVTGELKLKPATEGKGFIEGDDVQLVIGELLLAENFTHSGAHSELLPLKKVWELTGTDAGNYRFPTELPKVSAEITSDGKPGDSSGSDIALDVKDPSGKALKLVRTSGIPESAITQDLKDKGFDTETKIKAEMEKSLTADQKKNSVLYDLKLMVQDGSGWKEATAANFPAAGITVNLPYPSGTNKNDKFTIVHMFSTTANSKTAGQTETLSGSAVTNLDKAIRFKLTGLSPVLVTWTKSNTSGGNTTDKDDDKDDNDEETYRVRIADLSHGKITARPTRAEEGETVTLTVKPDSGYRLSSITVTDRRGKDVKLKEKSDTKYTFKMPARWVEVDATFVATTPTYTPTYPTTYYPSTQWNSNTTSCTGGASCPSRVFPDLDPAMWYHGSTDFVIQRGLMAGQSDGRFAPNVPLTRAMMVQILYTHAGRPIPSSSASFRDVDRGAWYENAVNWAAEQGVASGIGNNAFAPKSPVTREQLAVMLYNYASRRGISLQATQSRSSFSDSARISSWASSAVTVMQQAGIVSGKQGYIFDPKGRASRAETAQMLWKLLN